MSRTLKALLLSGLVALLLGCGATIGYFMVQNGNWVVVRFPTLQADWSAPVSAVEYETPLAVVMAAGIGVGFLLAVLIFLPSWMRRLWERRRERRFINSLEGELTDLRNLPVVHPAPLEDLPLAERSDRSQHRGSRREAEKDSDDDALLAAALREVEQERGR